MRHTVMRKIPFLVASTVLCGAICQTMSFSHFSLKQSINIPAVKMITSIVRNPSLAVPKTELTCLSELNLESLKCGGIKYLVFDKDNTLTYTYSDELHSSVRMKISECRQSFGTSSMAILSNSVGTLDDIDFQGARLTESRLGLKVIRHEQKKPGCLQEVALEIYLRSEHSLVFVASGIGTLPI